MSMYRIEDNIYAKETRVYGKSLYAKKDFAKDDVVFVAFGPIVTTPTIYTIPIDWEIYIDPTRPQGNLSQYICHSCEPKLGIKERNIFVAMQPIRKDEEVTLDYAMFVYEYGPGEPGADVKCSCGRKTCRGTLGFYRGLPEDVRERYKGYISEYLLHGH